MPSNFMNYQCLNCCQYLDCRLLTVNVNVKSWTYIRGRVPRPSKGRRVSPSFQEPRGPPIDSGVTEDGCLI